MRITKTVREYIENKVADAYYPKKDALRKDYDAKKFAVQKELEAARERWEAEAKAIVAAHGLSVDKCYRGGLCDLVAVSCCYGNDEWQPIYQAISAVTAEQYDAARNIIIEMELGGNREKLEAMLAAIGEK